MLFVYLNVLKAGTCLGRPKDARSAPVLTVQPSDVTATLGAHATFTAKATGHPAPTYQWQRSTDRGATWHNVSLAVHHPNHTTGVLTVADQGARFRVVVRNGNQAITSRASVLTVSGASVQVVAGVPSGEGYADGPGLEARFCAPTGMAIDASGNLLVADAGNHLIRMITPDGRVSTLAGRQGIAGSLDGRNHQATFCTPTGVAVDANGTVFVADSGNETIRKITRNGMVTTLAGKAHQAGLTDGLGAAARFSHPYALCVEPGTGDLLVADENNETIRRVRKDGMVSTPDWHRNEPHGGAPFSHPLAVVEDSDGRIYVASCGLCVIEPHSTLVTTITSDFDHQPGPSTHGGIYTSALALDHGGRIYTVTLGEPNLFRRSSEGLVSFFDLFDPSPNLGGIDAFLELDGLNGIAVDASGRFYVSSCKDHVIFRMDLSGQVHRFAGVMGGRGASDGRGGAARFRGPHGITLDRDSNLLVADTDNSSIRKISPEGEVTTLSALPGEGGVCLDHKATAWGLPAFITVDRLGQVYVADLSTSSIRKRKENGEVLTVAGKPLDKSGTGQYPPDPHLRRVAGFAVDGAGTLFVTNEYEHAVFKATPSGEVTPLAGTPGQSGHTDGMGGAAGFTNPHDLVLDAGGNLYVADSGNHAIRKITPDGRVSTLAGKPGDAGLADGPGGTARFWGPMCLAMDAAGNLYVADYLNSLIRKIAPDGMVSTVVGTPGVHANGTTSLAGPRGLVVDGNGYLYILLEDAVVRAKL